MKAHFKGVTHYNNNNNNNNNKFAYIYIFNAKEFDESKICFFSYEKT